MTVLASISFAALVGIICISACWAWRARLHGKLAESIDQSLDSIYPLLKDLEPYAVRGCFTDDAAFIATFGKDGTRKCVHNAGCLVRLCQRAYADNIIAYDDVRDVMLRAAHLRRIALLLPLEHLARRHVVSTIPHICARTIAFMYSELEANVEAILYRAPDTLDRLRAVV